MARHHRCEKSSSPHHIPSLKLAVASELCLQVKLPPKVLQNTLAGVHNSGQRQNRGPMLSSSEQPRNKEK